MSESQESTRRAALITGSSRGIGLAVAEQLAAAGFNVALNCSSEAGLPALHEQADRIAGEHGVQVEAIAASVADEAEANALVEQAHEAFCRLDAVVNNAGITRDGLMVRMKDDDFDRVMATHDVGQAIESGQIGSPLKGFNWHRENAVGVAPADADTHGADVHADTNTPTNAHRASISLRIASIASAMPSGLVPPP